MAFISQPGGLVTIAQGNAVTMVGREPAGATALCGHSACGAQGGGASIRPGEEHATIANA
uniref:hypothetical protein n=1 Tax=Paenibacillus abyssi TaxID=1340531 RepID=UPI003670D39D